ncbi:S8 family serine peptidase [Symbiobacterium terraclitae]|uniref:S8 family serine peptidase n=1 Tax=Symbiobacterium terraclitae TaxID=557451 RepID=UPI0035B50EA4
MKRVAVWLTALCTVLAASARTPALAHSEAVSPKDQVRADLTAPAVPGQFLVQFKPGLAAAQREAIATELGAKVVDRVAALDVEVLEFPALSARNDPKAAEEIIRTLKMNPNVTYVEPNYIFTATWTPNDPYFSQQWGPQKIQLPAAWDHTRGSSNVVIAIVDTGVQRNHPDLSAKLVPGWDFVDNDDDPDDENGHGTHVAGIAAGLTNNGIGIAGGCPHCRIMPVRVLDRSGNGSLANVAHGITWAADHGAQVINLSLGSSAGTTTLRNAIDYAWNRGAFLACAAGNDNSSSPTYPAYYSSCMAVAASTSSDARASFSNYGSWVDVAAPGQSIMSTWLGGGYANLNGTSMATPLVSGLAGILASQGLSNSQIWQRICSTADMISGTGTYWTCGRINAYRAVTYSSNPGNPGSPALQNGGFENGTAPWAQSSSGGYQLIDTTLPRTGSYSAWLGGYNNGTDAISQVVTVPQNGTLTFWWYMSSQEGSAIAYDYLRVRLYSQNGTLLATVATHSNRDTRNQWVQDTINLSAYAGQTVRLEFSATNDAILPTSFFIDDVSLQ